MFSGFCIINLLLFPYLLWCLLLLLRSYFNQKPSDLKSRRACPGLTGVCFFVPRDPYSAATEQLVWSDAPLFYMCNADVLQHMFGGPGPLIFPDVMLQITFCLCRVPFTTLVVSSSVCLQCGAVGLLSQMSTLNDNELDE